MATSQATDADWWQFVDTTLAQAIKNYEDRDLSVRNDHGVSQPIFIDLIIKLKICRAYSNNMNQKPLTAHRYLKEAADLIK